MVLNHVLVLKQSRRHIDLITRGLHLGYKEPGSSKTGCY